MSGKQQVWFVRPRDPLVLGDGRGPLPFFAQRAWPLPLPQTVAGMVRAQFVRAGHDVERETALRLLRDVHIEGPWLARRQGDAFESWVFAPADAAREREPEEGRYPLHRDEMVSLGTGGGVLLSGGAPAVSAVLVPRGQVEGRKTKAPFPFWPLRDAVGWALDLDAPTHDPGAEQPIWEEPRIHVKIQDGTGTAEPGMLFSSAGARFAHGFGLLLRVSGPELAGPGPRWPEAHEGDVVVLGGEGRPSFRDTVVPAAYPTYSQYEAQYEAALGRPGPARGLRLQLLTHACFYGPDASSGALACLPSWLQGGVGEHPALPGLQLRLHALRMERPVAVSGWDLQGGRGRSREGAPRQVRRLAPAGSVFYFELLDEKEPVAALRRACQELFAAPLDPDGGAPDEQDHRARPAHDGMGLCLPGLFPLTR